jgi:hypothetical protein
MEKKVAKKPTIWKCAIVADANGDIMIGTDGRLLRIRRLGELPIEVELVNCQETRREDLPRAEFDMDPMMNKLEEMQAFMKEQRDAAEEERIFRAKYGLAASIKNIIRRGE